jgi:hypothetical protein
MEFRVSLARKAFPLAVMPKEFKDNSATLFGREPDLQQLRIRAERSGVTAVVGRPQMGKSWLLTELARQLTATRTDVSDQSFLYRGYLVGFHEARGETPDLLLRAVSDLYARWLADSSLREKANAFYLQNQEGFVGRAGVAAGKIFSKLAGLASPSLKVISEIISEATSQLVDANVQLTSGGLQFKPLQADQALELLQIVHQISGNPLILIFDQWEKSPGIKMEGDILDSFIRHIEDWPPCHIFVALREEDSAYAAIERISDAYPGDCEFYPLLPMNLDSETSQNELLEYIRAQLPFTRDLSSEVLLDEIAGYPSVVSRWVKSRATIRTLADLKQKANDAHAFRYPEFNVALPQLNPSQLRLACRIVFLPLCGDPAYADSLKPIVLGASAESENDPLHEDSLDLLLRRGVLEESYPASYGHAKRAESARRWFEVNCHAELPEILSQLILALGSRIRSAIEEVLPYVFSLDILYSRADHLPSLPSLVQSVLSANRSLLLDSAPDANLHISFPLDGSVRHVASLLAMGLRNTLNHAEAQEDLTRRDALLKDLRDLHGAYPDDQAVREHFAMGLANMLSHAKTEENLTRQDALLENLRTLQIAYPDDQAIRKPFAIGLYNMMFHAKAKQDLPHLDALFNSLRALQSAYPDDSAVREEFAKGLYNMLFAARVVGDLPRRDALLKDLSNLQITYPDDRAVGESFAKGLFNTLIDAQAEGDQTRRDTLLNSLSELHAACPDNPAVREPFLRGLVNTLIDATQEQDLPHLDALFNSLRALQSAYPDDPAVREEFAKGLYNLLFAARAMGDLPRREALLKDLSELQAAYPDDPAVREEFATGLLITLNDTIVEGDLPCRDELLDGLNELQTADPDNPAAQEQLAREFLRRFIDSENEAKPLGAHSLIAELLEIVLEHPHDPTLLRIIEILSSPADDNQAE